MATQMAGQVAGEAIKVIADYVKSLKEPPEEVVRAFGRLEKFIDDYNARIQALGPIELLSERERVIDKERADERANRRKA